jgi:hypothetical protein
METKVKYAPTMTEQTCERMIQRYTDKFNQLHAELLNDFNQLKWNMEAMIHSNEMIHLYRKLMSCGCDVDSVYEYEIGYVLKGYNAMQKSTNEISNFEHRVRYVAKLDFLEEIKPYLSK